MSIITHYIIEKPIEKIREKVRSRVGKRMDNLQTECKECKIEK